MRLSALQRANALTRSREAQKAQRQYQPPDLDWDELIARLRILLDQKPSQKPQDAS